jgi:hypothetical protein
MAIRDRFRRALRKQSSPGPIRHTDTTLTIDSNTSNESEGLNMSLSFSPNSRTSFFTRAFTWSSARRGSRTARPGESASGDTSDSNEVSGALTLTQQVDLTLSRTPSEAEREMKAEKKRQRKAKYQNAGKIHPRDKPLTAQNLRHQAMLGTWSWDDSANGSSRRSFTSGISPCCTRPPSIYQGDETDDYFGNGGVSSSSSAGFGDLTVTRA